MTREKISQIQWKAEDAADSAKYSWQYAMTNGDREMKERWFREAEFKLRLSHAYTDILKSISND